jgi:hypothetical protein
MAARRARSHVAALVVTALLAAVVPARAAAAPVGDCRPGAGWAAPVVEPAARVVDLVNQHRAGLGLAPLAVSPTLSAAAVWKARHMATYRYRDRAPRRPPAIGRTGHARTSNEIVPRIPPSSSLRSSTRLSSKIPSDALVWSRPGSYGALA